MAVNINTFKLFVEFCQNKVQVGNTVTPSQFNLLCNQAQLTKFEYDRQLFIATNEISNYLALFLKKSIINVPSSGEISYPDDWQHTSAVRSYYPLPRGKSVEVEVKESKDKSWGEVMTSQLLKPTRRFPKFMQFSGQFRFLPRDIGIVMLDYFSTPVTPNWAYTIVSGRPVYDPINSVDFQWNTFALNEIAMIYLQLIGINIKDSALSEFAVSFQQETKATL
jgi:hypothetical protein